MPSTPASATLSRLIASDRFADIVRVSLSLIGVAVFCYSTGALRAIIPAMLGGIACALSETDESWRRRPLTLSVTLVCFAGTSLIVEVLTDYPPLFAFALVGSAFSLVMLGAVSARWRSVATGTLLLAVYTMIGMEQQPPGHRDILSGPLFLTLGAAWYGLFSLAFSAIAPMTAVRHTLADLFEALAVQIDCVATLFAPYRDVDHAAVHRELARTNSKVVATLNAARLALLDRLGRGRPKGETEERLQLYFAAQDIHERIHSAHYPHEELAAAFFHSDLLFRCSHLLKLQAETLRAIAGALRRRAALPVNAAAQIALADVQNALDHAVASGGKSARLVDAVNALMRNVRGLQDALDNPLKPDVTGQVLQNPDPATLKEAWDRLLSQFNVRSAVFRHAVRLSAGLLAGYVFLRLFHLHYGFWILLTTLLVIQPSYGATQKRLIERVAGTVAGVVGGWAALHFVPGREIHLLLIVVAAALFFAWRRRRYAAGTAMITLFVVLCFNLVLGGYAVIWPRLFDTLIGVAISLLLFYFVLPDWTVRRLAGHLSELAAADARYLRRILGQYRSGRADDLAYRIARRDAHNRHAGFDGVVRDILSEPRHTATKTDEALRALELAHQLLSYLSALGAHRRGGVLGENDALAAAGEAVCARLEALSAAYRSGAFGEAPQTPAVAAEEPDDLRRLIGRQFGRIDRLGGRLMALGPRLSAD
jgi:YccS/YhfK family integral membrane protein